MVWRPAGAGSCDAWLRPEAAASRYALHRQARFRQHAPGGLHPQSLDGSRRQFIDRGFTGLHNVVEYWDSPLLKIFHGKVSMRFDDPNTAPVRPTMAHFFYMDEKDSTKVKHWIGVVGPTGF